MIQLDDMDYMLKFDTLRFRVWYVIVLLVVFSVFSTLALSRAHAASESSVLVNVAPENPTPFEDVNITLNSYASNLDSVLITWSVNGKNILSGIGKKSFSLKTGPAGSTSIVTVVVSLPDGDITKTITIKPSVMTLLFQANDSYVPAFYRGKALPTLGSEIKVVAMPEIGNPKNMTYAWQKDYTNKEWTRQRQPQPRSPW